MKEIFTQLEIIMKDNFEQLIIIHNFKDIKSDNVNELELAIGDLVIVPFRNKELTGIVWQLDIEVSEKYNKIKSIKS